MPSFLIRNERIYQDGLGNERMEVRIFFIPTNRLIEEHAFVSLKEYKAWLRERLQVYDLKMRSLKRQKNKYFIHSIFKSFYTILYDDDCCDYGDVNGWEVEMMVPLLCNSKRCKRVEDRFDTLMEAINFLRTQPVNHDFAIMINSIHEVYEMNDTNMMMLMLKYSDN